MGVTGVFLHSAGTLINNGLITATLTGGAGKGVTLTAGGTLTNAGTISTAGGTAVAFGSIGVGLLIDVPGAVFGGSIFGGSAGNGIVELASSASVGTIAGFGSSVTNFGSLVFDGGSRWTVAGNASSTGLGTISVSGFAVGDTIDLTGFAATSETFAANVLTLTNAATVSTTMHVVGAFSPDNFHIAPDGGGGTNITLQPDTTPPAATIVVANTALRIGQTSPVTITFSEAVSGFTNADLTVPNGTLSAVSSADNGITWTATFTPAASLRSAANLITLTNTGVADLAGNPGTGSTPSNSFAIDTTPPRPVIFAAQTTLGTELWVTDGTSAGTLLLKDIDTRLERSSNPSGLTALGNGKVVFAAIDATNGNELWATDGTPGGTTLVKNINTAAGGAAYSNPTLITAFGTGKALFSATDNFHGSELWITDGTTAGTTLVRDIEPLSSNAYLAGLASLGNGKAVFSERAFKNAAHSYQLWVTDGTTPGTQRLNIATGNTQTTFTPQAPVVLGAGRALFTATDGSNGYELWATDGTSVGTSMLKDINPGAGNGQVRYLTLLGTRMVFQANDGTHGNELWVTDGSAANTSMLMDIDPGGAATNSNPSNFTLLGNGKALFQAKDSTNAYKLWVTDGTSGGTSMLGTAYPETVGAAVGGGKAVFLAGSKFSPVLWVSDGTAGGTSVLRGVASTNLTSLGNGTALFASSDGTGAGQHGNELWVTDGTSAGTSMVSDIYPGTNGSNPAQFTVDTLIDTTPPAVPVVTSPALTDLPAPVVAGTAEANSTVTVTVDGATYSTVATAGGAWSIDLAVATPLSGALALNHNGPNTVSVTATDGAGNVSPAATQTLILDTTPPPTPIITSPALTDIPVPVVTGTAEANSTVTVIVAGEIGRASCRERVLRLV